MNNIDIQSRIDRFTTKGNGYKNFIVLVAQLPIYSIDLLYNLWYYFNKNISYLVVSDLLVSSLSRPIGANQFRLEEQTRDFLRKEVIDEKTIQELKNLVFDYIETTKDKTPKNIYSIYKEWCDIK